MTKICIAIALIAMSLLSFYSLPIAMNIHRSLSLDSLDACQGAHYQHGKVYLYGDRETGVIREYVPQQDTLLYTGNELEGFSLLNTKTGIAVTSSRKNNVHFINVNW